MKEAGCIVRVLESGAGTQHYLRMMSVSKCSKSSFGTVMKSADHPAENHSVLIDFVCVFRATVRVLWRTFMVSSCCFDLYQCVCTLLPLSKCLQPFQVSVDYPFFQAMKQDDFAINGPFCRVVVVRM